MNKILKCLAISFLIKTFIVSNLLAQDFSLVKHYFLYPHVLIVQTGEVYPDKIVAVSTEKGIVIIDSGISPTLTAHYRKIVEQQFPGQKIKYVINTHSDFDHTNGNIVFSDATIIAQQNCTKRMFEFYENMDEFVKSRKERYERREKLAQTLDKNTDLYKRLRDLVFTSKMMYNDYENNFALRPPDLIFKQELSIDLGNTTCNLFYFDKNLHTDNDILVHFPEMGLVFTGDLFGNYKTNSYYSSDLNYQNFINVLNKILNENNPVRSVITVHSNILSKERIEYEYNNFIKLKNIIQTKNNGIDIIKSQLELSKLPTHRKLFNELSKYSKEYYFLEADLNILGDDFLNKGKYQEALIVFHLNTLLHSESIDTIEWLAYAYYEAKDYKKAEEYFKKALNSNPVNSYAADMIFLLQNK